MQTITRSPNRIYTHRIFTSSSAPSTAVTATTVVNQITATLVGVGTSWTGSPFSKVSGPGTIASQTVTNSTHASVKLNVTGTGNFVLSDGVTTFTVTQPATGGTGFGYFQQSAAAGYFGARA